MGGQILTECTKTDDMDGPSQRIIVPRRLKSTQAVSLAGHFGDRAPR